MKKRYILLVFSCLFSLQVLAEPDSYTQFFHAVEVDDGAVAAALLERGFDPDAVDEQGNSALMLALRERSIKVAELLLAQPGIDLEHRNAHDENAVMIASLQGQLDLLRQMVDAGAEVNKPGWTALAYAASTGQADVVTYLLEQSAYIDAQAPGGSSPLMLAAYFGHDLVARLLLDAGADATLRNVHGFSAADLARQHGDGALADAIEAVAKSQLAQRAAPGS